MASSNVSSVKQKNDEWDSDQFQILYQFPAIWHGAATDCQTIQLNDFTISIYWPQRPNLSKYISDTKNANDFYALSRWTLKL